MSLLRTATTLGLVALLIAAPVSANSATDFGGPSDEIEKLRGKLEKIENRIQRELKKIERKSLPAAREEWGKLADEGVNKAIVAGILRVAETHKGAIAQAKERKRRTDPKLRAAIETLLDAEIGPHFSRWLTPAVVGFMIDQGFVDDAEFDAAGVWLGIKEDRLDFSDFDQAYEAGLSKELFPKIADLEADRTALQTEIRRLEEIAAAAQAGLPHGMVAVPAKKHRLGVDESECRKLTKQLKVDVASFIKLRRSAPAQDLELDEFYIDRYEVTSEWYAAFLRDLQSDWYTEYTKNNPQHTIIKSPLPWRVKDSDAGWAVPEDFEKRPVTGISQLEAAEFCAWMGRRLPTEFEWEAAARFNTDKRVSQIWPWGDKWLKEEPANWSGRGAHPKRSNLRQGLPHVIPVGTFPKGANPLGIQDMAGNAWEWTTSPYVPYPGFKDINIKGVRLTFADFQAEEVVIRGGDALKREMVVSNVWRTGISPTQRSAYVGFRTAASAVRGKDQVDWYVRGDPRLATSLVGSTTPLSGDTQVGRKYAALVLDDPTGYSVVTSGGWDAEAELPCRARHILAIRREVNGIRSVEVLKNLARDEPVMLGYLKLDHATSNPPLAAGEYLVSWRNSFVPEPEEGEGNEAEGKDEKGKKGKKEEPEAIPDGFLFKRIKTKDVQEPVFFSDFIAPVVDSKSKQPTRIAVNADRNRAEVIFSFPISKSTRNQSFLVTIPLTFAEEGVAAKLK